MKKLLINLLLRAALALTALTIWCLQKLIATEAKARTAPTPFPQP